MNDERSASSVTTMLDDEPLDATLPADLQVAMGRFLGGEAVPTLRSWVLELREALGDGGLPVDALCFSATETSHRAVVDGEQEHYFACCFDAVILAAIVDEAVDLWTESPSGVPIRARAIGSGELNVDPGTAVFSFGIDRHVAPPEGGTPSLQYGYEMICPFVQAFPSPSAYREWAPTTPAPTVAMTLAGATQLAALIASEDA